MTVDYKRHNEEVKRVWDAYHARRPVRVPMILGISSRNYLLDDKVNKEHVTYKEYFDSPETMLRTQVHFTDHIRHNIPHDIEMGVPEEGWTVLVDFQNVYDAAWFGAPIIFPEGQCPDTRAPYKDDARKGALVEKPLPQPFAGFMGKVREFYEYFMANRERFIHRDRPIKEVICGFPASTDGPFTLACQLRGTEALCTDMIVDTDYFHEVMGYLTDALVQRIAAWRKYFELPGKAESFFMADDFVQLLSIKNYRQHVLPYHRRLYESFSTMQNNAIHLCGDATRLFPTIHRELGVMQFDTGFPVDFGWLRNELGPDVEILGGPHVDLLRRGGPGQTRQRTQEILESGIMEGGRFILREGNNLAPGTPVENIEAMYSACKEFGCYSEHQKASAAH